MGFLLILNPSFLRSQNAPNIKGSEDIISNIPSYNVTTKSKEGECSQENTSYDSLITDILLELWQHEYSQFLVGVGFAASVAILCGVYFVLNAGPLKREHPILPLFYTSLWCLVLGLISSLLG